MLRLRDIEDGRDNGSNLDRQGALFYYDRQRRGKQRPVIVEELSA